ncbi:MAG: acyl-[acyl-carrier-protein] thioesterase [Tractidigestivibacter sp.]|jgi:medium-chain acyl-[acyl-carrier-protein] hydrolase|uniref:acyl-[acyl-carrier-protein] thioesterase n=1 Tax=Tractidigestivibacter sp. TaxID=2847320 RepID=UPI003D89EF09
MYSFDGRVRYSECDEDGVLTLYSMMNYLQDCSTFHSEAVHRGLKELNHDHLGWFVTSWLIQIYDMPRFTDDITISTWCYDLKSIRASRAFRIADEQGNTRVLADSQWCLFNFQEKKVVTIGEPDRVYLEDTPRPDLPKISRRLAPSSDAAGQSTRPIVVTEQYLDTNRHVNNAEYLRFSIGAADAAGYSADPTRLDIQYREMALLGDTIQPVVFPEGDGACTVSLNAASGKPYAIVRLGAIK